MKSIKFYLFGFLSIALLSVGLYACSNEDSGNNEKPQSVGNIQAKTNEYAGLVAVISNGVATVQFDEAELKKSLLAEGTFATVESVELTYGINPSKNEAEAFLTLVGTESATSANVAIVVDLFINGNQIIIKDFETHPEVYSEHSCKGENCASCSFTRSGLFGKITGCNPCGKVIDESKAGVCNHSVTGSGGIGALLKELTKVIPFVL